VLTMPDDLPRIEPDEEPTEVINEPDCPAYVQVCIECNGEGWYWDNDPSGRARNKRKRVCHACEGSRESIVEVTEAESEAIRNRLNRERAELLPDLVAALSVAQSHLYAAGKRWVADDLEPMLKRARRVMR